MMKIYSVYDVRANHYSTPMLFVNDSIAIRDVCMAFTPDSMLYKFPEDYNLICLGEFDQETGKYNLDESQYPILVSKGTEIKNIVTESGKE